MKTLKKTLCLVLAVVMVVGVLILPAHAADATTEDADATTAFNTLLDYGVMVGVDSKNTPALDKNINRQDMAAIIYRVMTGDTTNKYVGNYVGLAEKFADSATFATWAKGYIGFVREREIFMGDENGNFKPTEEIKGSDVLTVLLRCIGYGKEGEFKGANYAQAAQTCAASVNLFGGATGYLDVKKDMDKAISRGIVAKLVYNAVQVPMVTYLNGNYSAYQSNGLPVAPNTPDAKKNPSLISVDKGVPTAATIDKWGAPTKTAKPVATFNAPLNAVKKNLKTKELIAPADEFWTAKTECDVAAKVGLKKDAKDVKVYTNGKINLTETTIHPTNTTSTLGAQGRWTRVYDTDLDGTVDRIVYVDTALAKVTNVTTAETDAAGHVKNPATMTLEVYLSDTSAIDGGVSVEQTKAQTDATAFTYSKGDYVLVNYIQNGTNSAAVSASTDVTTTYAQDKNVYVVSAAPSFPGKQTTIWYNADKHTIDGTDYNDNIRFHLDQAGTKGGNYTWFKDSKDNLIGAVAIANVYSYGVIKNIWWDGDHTTGAGSAKATVVYMDGSEAVITLGHVTVGYKGANSAVSGSIKGGVPTYSVVSSDVMTFSGGKLYVATDAATNAALQVQNTTDGNDNVIGGHLFRFTQMANGKVEATEVYGNGADYNQVATAAGLIAGNFKGLANINTAVNKGKSTVVAGKLLVDDNTVFLIKSGNTYTSITGYNKISSYDSGEVDYVNCDDDVYAEYVYITASAKDAKKLVTFYTSDFALDGLNYKWNTTYSAANNAAGQTVYTLYGYVDGVYTTIQTLDKSIVTWITGYSSATHGTAQNQLWLLHTTNGFVDGIVDQLTKFGDVEPANTTAFTINNDTVGAATVYANSGRTTGSADVPTLYANTTTVKLDGEVADTWTAGTFYDASAKKSYDITTKSIVVGETANLAGKKITLVYNNNNQIVLAFIADVDTASTPSTTPETYVVDTANKLAGITVNGVSFKAAATYFPKTTSNLDALKGALANPTELSLAELSPNGDNKFEIKVSMVGTLASGGYKVYVYGSNNLPTTTLATAIGDTGAYDGALAVGNYIVIAMSENGSDVDSYAARYAVYKVVA